jgi:hypothetical protein
MAVIVPSAQSWQVLLEDGWNLPMGQSLHSVDLASAYWPLAQASQLMALKVILNLPAVHGAHLAPTATTNVPGAHTGVGAGVGDADGPTDDATILQAVLALLPGK